MNTGGPPATADTDVNIVGSSLLHPTLLGVCVFLVECLITVVEVDLLDSNAVFHVVTVQVLHVSLELRLSSSCSC